MRHFLRQFPFSHDRRRFALVLAAALDVACAGILAGIVLAPIPPRPADELPADARLALTVPPNATLTDAAAVVSTVLPSEAVALTRYEETHPSLAAALVSREPATLTVFTASASGTAQFMMETPMLDRAAVFAALAQTYPQKRQIRLPDGRVAEELVADPSAVAAGFVRVPGTDWLVFFEDAESFAYREHDTGFMVTSLPVKHLQNLSFLPASRSFCLLGTPAAIAGPIPPRWRLIRFPVPSYPLPIIVPILEDVFPLDGITIKMANFC